MARNFQCWVIVAGAQPTSFRARRAEDLLPTLRQLQRTQPSVSMKWFERGRFWDSPEAAREAEIAKRRRAADRGRDWRPGGQHADPRARFEVPRAERRARFKKRLIAAHRPADAEPRPQADTDSTRRRAPKPPGARPSHSRTAFKPSARRKPSK